MPYKTIQTFILFKKNVYNLLFFYENKTKQLKVIL